MVMANSMNKANEMQLGVYNLNLSSEIKAEFRRAKTGREVRICLGKGAKSIAKQMVTLGMNIRKVEPIVKVIKTSLQGQGMTAEAAQVGGVIVEVEETAAAAGEGITLSTEAAGLLTPVAEAGGDVVVGSGFNPVVVIVVIVVIAIAYWCLRGQVQTHNQQFLLNNEYRKLHRELMKLHKKAR